MVGTRRVEALDSPRVSMVLLAPYLSDISELKKVIDLILFEVRIHFQFFIYLHILNAFILSFLHKFISHPSMESSLNRIDF